jgi:hypothetical protein
MSSYPPGVTDKDIDEILGVEELEDWQQCVEDGLHNQRIEYGPEPYCTPHCANCGINYEERIEWNLKSM